MKNYLAMILLFVSFHSLSFAGIEEANRVYEKGEFDQAFKLYLPLALQDEPDAQDMVGVMYMLGVGTERNYALGTLWLSLAANHGIDYAKEARDTLMEEYKDDILIELKLLK